MPRTPFRQGVTELTRLCGQEYPGLVLLTTLAMENCLTSNKKLSKEKHLDLQNKEKK